MREEADAQPRDHQVARLFDEHNRFVLDGLDHRTEIRLVRKWPIRSAGARLSPMTVARPRVKLQPGQWVSNRLNKLGSGILTSSFGRRHGPRCGSGFYRSERELAWVRRLKCCDQPSWFFERSH